MDLQAFGSGQITIQLASNQRFLDMLPQLHQTSQIDGSSESVALSRKGRILMEQVRTVGWMWQNLSAVQYFKLVFGLPGGLWLGTVLLHQNVLLVDQCWVLLFQLFVDPLQLLTVKFGTDGTTILNQLKMHDFTKFRQTHNMAFLPN